MTPSRLRLFVPLSITMGCIVLTPLCEAQTIPPEAQAYQDSLLKGLTNIAVAHPTPSNDWVRQLVSNDDIITLALDLFKRYRIPVRASKLMPVKLGTQVAYNLPRAPTLSLEIITHVTECGAGCTAKFADMKLTLWDEAILKRQPKLPLVVPIWDTQLSLHDSLDDRREIRDAITRMIEGFCLSFLSANRQ